MVKKSKNSGGFTLVEIMVALSIFVIVALITSSILVSLTLTNQKMESIRTATDNINFTLNSMAIKIREGSQLQLAGTCPDHVSLIDFRGNHIGYSLNAGCVANENGSCLTSSQITVTKLKFCIQGKSSCAACNNTITIMLEAVANQGTRSATNLNAQTTVTQRNK